jgi:selenide,water dikinase
VEATAQVLRGLPVSSDPNLLVGPEYFSDAGVYRLREDLALVQTTDFFPPLVDDPYTFGRIAAANSLSDLYAMGAKPITALNIVGYPDDQLPIETLSDILRGGSDTVTQAGAVIVGGHSVRDTEIKYGLAVTGIVDPRRLVTNRGARPGDRLLLTKPLGSGVLTSAAKKGLIPTDDLTEAIAVMTQLNDAGSAAMLEAGVSAATDVTGFGLLGHAYEMAEASRAVPPIPSRAVPSPESPAGVTLRLTAGRVPLMHQTLDLARRGCLTRACKATLQYLGSALIVAPGLDDVLLRVLSDAQTSGGLLLCVAAPKAEALLTALHRAGYDRAADIGVVEPRGHAAITVDP